MNIPSLTTIGRRELAQRVTGGLEITLYWNAYDNSTSIEIHTQAIEETVSFPVPAHRALDAFHHPFAHLTPQEAA
ncbi:MAG TPA: hypothetical protein VF101_17250 [Gaiellaceae bacterium]